MELPRELPWPHYSPTGKDFAELYAEYERRFGVRPPPGNNEDDYRAAYHVLDAGEWGDPVKVWPSQKT